MIDRAPAKELRVDWSEIALREAAEVFVHLLSPFAPHLADELWSTLGGEGHLLERAWPDFDEALVRDDEVEIGVQINGKVRARVRLAPDADRETALTIVLEAEPIAAYLAGRTPKNVVYVPAGVEHVQPVMIELGDELAEGQLRPQAHQVGGQPQRER